MTRIKRTSGARKETAPAKVEGEGGAEQYAGAFARARLVRAWIAVAAAMVAMLYAYVALLERVVRWWWSSSFHARFRARLPARMIAVLSAMSLLSALTPAGTLAQVPSVRRLTTAQVVHDGSGTANVTVTVNATAPAPTVSTSPHLGDRRDVSQCVADCFESTLAYTTPAYYSLDVPRELTLLYRSGRAYPHGTVTLDVTDPNATATSFMLKLKDPSNAYVPFSNGTPELYFARNTSGATRIVAQFPATNIPTSARLYTAEVTMIYPSGVQGTTAVPIRVIVINDKDSPFGAGVDIVGLQRLFVQSQPGTVLITDGSGSASLFSGGCSPSVSCTFASPGGDFSTLSAGNNLYKRTYPDGSVVTFNASGNQLSTKSRFGDSTYVTYSALATGVVVPVAITDPVGASIVFWWRGAGEGYGIYKEQTLGNIRLPGTVDIPLAVNLTNDMWLWVETGGGTYRYRTTYDAQHRLAGVQLKNDSTWTYTYRYGATVDSSVAPSVKLANGTTARPRVALRNAADALLIGAATGGGTSTANALAVPADPRAKLTDPRGNPTYLTLSRFGSPTKIEAPLTGPAYAEYDTVTGQLKRSVSPTGDVSKFTWVGDQLRQTIDSTAGKTVNIDYETSYSLPLHVYGSVADQYFTYDKTKAGWPIKETRLGSSTAQPTTYVTDAFGRPTSVTDPNSHVTSYGYETTGLRNNTSVTAANGQATTFTRDAFGRPVTARAPTSAISSTGYDVLNRVLWTSSPSYNDTTRYQYDALNNPTVVTDAKGQVYTTVRNALGWVVKQIDPASRADSMAYDVAGNVTYVRTRQNRQVSLEYDALNRVIKKIGLSNADTITYAYDAGSRWVSARTVRGTELVSVDTIFTDSVGRTVKEATVRSGSASAWMVASFYGSTDPARTGVDVYATAGGFGSLQGSALNIYDGLKRLGTIQLPTGQTLFSYNADQLVDSIGFSQGSLGQRLYYTSSHALARRLYNVVAVKNAFDGAYRTDSVARLVERATGVGTQFQLFDYDLKGRLAYWQKKHQTSTPTCVNSPSGYGYDCSGSQVVLDSIVSAIYDNVENPADLGATLDPGNRLRTFNGAAMTYDFDGNLLTKGAYSYEWDDFGQLTRVLLNGAVQATFAYDGFGRRVKKTTSTGTVQYVWDGDQIILEADGSGTTLQTYTYYPGTDRLHSVTAGGVTYYASTEPATGDVNGLVRGSDNAVAAQYAYTPWGELEIDSTNIGNSLRWKGLVYDRETGLYYMRGRYYDPKIRRFISEDPIGIDGGINQYAFGGGDPINRNDPSGLDPQYLPGVTVWGTNGFTGCWGLFNTYGENGMEMRTWGQEQCGAGANGPAVADFTVPRVGPASPPSSPSVGPRPSPDKATCAILGLNAAAQTAADISVIFGVGIAAKTAYYGGKTLAGGLLAMANRWALEEMEMTYVMQGRAASKAQLMRTGRAKAFNVIASGVTASPGATVWSNVKSIGKSFVPGWNAYDAISTFKNACID